MGQHSNGNYHFKSCKQCKPFVCLVPVCSLFFSKTDLYYVNDQLQRAHPLPLNVCSNSYLKSCICRRFDKNTNSNNFLPKISTTVRSKRSYHGMFKRFRLSISSYNDYLLRDLEGACFQVEIQLTSSSISTRCRLSSGRKHC